MKQLLVILIGLSLISCQQKQEASLLTIDVSDDIVIPKHYIISKTNEDIIIDGNAEETSWENAKFTDKFIDIEGVKTPKFDTQVKMLWDEKYLYVYAELEEPHIWGNLKQRDTIIYYNNDFEVFLDPSNDGINYGEIELNALNTVWDLYLNKPYRIGGKANFEWNLNDLKSAVQIHGTLNNPNDIDSLWTVEMAIPLKPLIGLKNAPKTIPKEGEQWRINFSRVQWNHDVINGKYYRKKEDGKYLREYNWVWSNQKVINMHEPEKWGFLQFTEQTTSDGIKFIEDEDLEIKQTAFALFRKTRYGDLKTLLENDLGFSQNLEVTYSEEKTVNAIFYKTNFGFEYKLENEHSTYIINQEGTLRKL
ncbi:carbohydrate-binding family 9-like protein [Flavobacteriaceae bacterium S0825]|uniref:sugar-binding protein n=1 Tax=Gaetbulibacter sp. S0825 TaxID=2720084 RepID=UPI00142F6E20|nr:carbohydrate-binding family 9-like protein [Flavobacteriaceae bacterium S0825]NIX64568.1 carbohydrate-binding family 9-like protein [Gaetbulibacter sp. S0825]